MIGVGSYALSAAALAALAAALAFSAHRLRAHLIPEWTGAPARLVEAITGIALLIWVSELLGSLHLLYAWALVACTLLAAGAIAWWTRPSGSGSLPADPPAGGMGGGGSTDSSARGAPLPP